MPRRGSVLFLLLTASAVLMPGSFLTNTTPASELAEPGCGPACYELDGELRCTAWADSRGADDKGRGEVLAQAVQELQGEHAFPNASRFSYGFNLTSWPCDLDADACFHPNYREKWAFRSCGIAQGRCCDGKIVTFTRGVCEPTTLAGAPPGFEVATLPVCHGRMKVDGEIVQPDLFSPPCVALESQECQSRVNFTTCMFTRGYMNLDPNGRILTSTDPNSPRYGYARDLLEAARYLAAHEYAHVEGKDDAAAADFARNLILRERSAAPFEKPRLGDLTARLTWRPSGFGYSEQDLERYKNMGCMPPPGPLQYRGGSVSLEVASTTSSSLTQRGRPPEVDHLPPGTILITR